MVIAQGRSDAAPRLGAVALGSAIDLVRVAQSMGIDTDPIPNRLDLGLVRRIATSAAALGIGRDVAMALHADQLQAARIPALVDRLTQSLRESPLPRPELELLSAVFDLDSIGRLVGTSSVSLRRYLAGTRQTPDIVAARIHWLALAVGDLRGAYNAIGVRRWFERPRSALGGRTPATILEGEWDPEDADVQAVRALAAALTGPGMAT